MTSPAYALVARSKWGMVTAGQPKHVLLFMVIISIATPTSLFKRAEGLFAVEMTNSLASVLINTEAYCISCGQQC